MTPKHFSTAAEILADCQTHKATFREVITDLNREPPRVYVICGDKTYMTTPHELAELGRMDVLPRSVIDYFVEQGLIAGDR